MSNTPLPPADYILKIGNDIDGNIEYVYYWHEESMRAHAAAVSAADNDRLSDRVHMLLSEQPTDTAVPLYAAPPATATSADYAMGYAEGFNDACNPVPAVPLTPRELELIDGMIQAQVYRAEQSSRLGNKVMGLRQQGWDLERAELLRKLRGIGGGGK